MKNFQLKKWKVLKYAIFFFASSCSALVECIKDETKFSNLIFKDKKVYNRQSSKDSQKDSVDFKLKLKKLEDLQDSCLRENGLRKIFKHAK